MTTVRDIISGAYGRLALLPLGSTLDPARAASGLSGFIDLVNALAGEGITPGGPVAPQSGYDATGQNQFPPHGPSNTVMPLADAPASFQLSDPFPFPSFFEGGFKALLAEQLADDSGTVVGAGTAKDARACKRALLAYYVIAPSADSDKAVTRMPSQRRWWR